MLSHSPDCAAGAEKSAVTARTKAPGSRSVGARSHAEASRRLRTLRSPKLRELEGPAAAVTKDQINRIKVLLLKDVPDDAKAAAQRKKDIEESMRVINLSDIDRELIIRWLLQDDRVVFGGEPISGPPK